MVNHPKNNEKNIFGDKTTQYNFTILQKSKVLFKASI